MMKLKQFYGPFGKIVFLVKKVKCLILILLFSFFLLFFSQFILGQCQWRFNAQ